MIDTPGLAEPRFPSEKEEEARDSIRKILEQIIQRKGPFLGIAGAACGGDILFHELCVEMNIPSEIFLALPATAFKKKSVSFAGKNWEDRFDLLVDQLPVHTQPQGDETENVWASANTWMLNVALKNNGANMALIALWNMKRGDGAGGTEHMVNIAKKYNGDVEIIDTNKL